MKEKIQEAYALYTRQIDAIFQEISTQSEDRLNHRTNSGWSALQTVHHLLLVEEGSLRYIKKKMSHDPILNRVGSGARFRSLLLWISLQSPFKFKAPKTVNEEHFPERSSLPELRARWQDVQQSWQDYLEQMPSNWLDKAIYRHPRAGLLGWIQVIDFFRHHTARHAKQIRRAIASANEIM